MIAWILLLLSFSPDCWDVYQDCTEPCRESLNACWIREGWDERIICITGPGNTSGVQWCRLEFWPSSVMAGAIQLTCSDTLPRWCRNVDYDNDNDVDLKDIADWLRSY